MELTPFALVVIALILAGWTIASIWVIVRANAKVRRHRAMQTSLVRMQRMFDMAPAIPLSVRVDGRIEGPSRLANWLGLNALPAYLSELYTGEVGGLSREQVEQLSNEVRATQRSARPFELVLTPPGAKRSLAFFGMLADPQISPGGAVIVWVFDFTRSETELSQLRSETARVRTDFAALVGLIDAAPMPMWFRDADMRLRLVNNAFVAAVGAEDLESVIEEQIELLEPEGRNTPRDIARDVMLRQEPKERIDAVTIDGARRSLRVTELPLGREGVAGYANDVEEEQRISRAFKAFRKAQRAMLDQLSVGVAQFDTDERMIFANLPFRRQFGLRDGVIEDRVTFEQFLAEARDHGATPEVRDFPEWRRERRAWFDATETQEENWPLSGGTHLRVVAQTMPDSGMVLIAEDQTEHLELSATRDTMLRTRTAMLDSLFEALAIFAPDGSVQIWNRSFAGTWGLSTDLLDTHPSAEELVGAIGRNVADPADADRIGAAVRAATLDRREKGGQVLLTDGRTLRFAGVPLPDGNGLLIVLDITASQKAEQALRERAIALEEADAVKARFLANMSYEFRTPLTTIGGFAELLASGAAGELDERAREYVEAILTSTERLTEEVENVLDLSQSEAGLLPIEKEPIDLLDFLSKLVRDREQAILSAGLSLDLKGRKGRVAEADPRQFARAIGNLLDNAIEHTPVDGRIKIDMPKPRPDSGWSATIVISDNGPGMGTKDLARALGKIEPHAGAIRAEDASERAGAGTGLGIRLSRELIEGHGGVLELSSHRGSGTVATIHLP
ncbi:MAG: PAS-domain containing protein [Erythrobacter sp.]|uniref:sensor histidine kinase n=1 Tax=Erythrobacter sp. TaxID=1042 RepID=UPI003C76E8AF